MDAGLESDLERFRGVLESRFGGHLVTLAAFGSRVQGRARPESNLDLLAVIRGMPRQRLARRRLLAPLLHAVSDGFAETLSLILLTPEEASTVKPFYLGMLDGHRLLVDRGSLFAAILDRLRHRLEELGARRLTDESGNPSWDPKPDCVLGEDIVLWRPARSRATTWRRWRRGLQHRGCSSSAGGTTTWPVRLTSRWSFP